MIESGDDLPVLMLNSRADFIFTFDDEVLPIERLLLDLHSGRFFGRFGPWVMDAAAVLIVLLGVSGTWIWLRRRR